MRTGLDTLQRLVSDVMLGVDYRMKRLAFVASTRKMNLSLINVVDESIA